MGGAVMMAATKKTALALTQTAAGTVLPAATAICPHQAFAPHTRALGRQFHPEVDPARFEQWLIGHVGELE